MAGAAGASAAMTEAASVRELVEEQVDRFLSSEMYSFHDLHLMD